MPNQLRQQRLHNRRKADRQFLELLITTGQTLAVRAPEPEARQAATRVTRRLKLLLL